MAEARLSTGAALLRQRLSNSRLTASPFRSAEDAVGWFGAVQAQDYAGAKWALGQRLRKAREDVLERAIDAGALLRTHVLRPTWHFVLPRDIRWMLKLSAPRIRALMAYYDRKLELDEPTFRRSNTALAKALQGGKHLTRSELAEVLANVRIRASGQRLGHLVMRAELDAIVCSGPRRGKQFTYALLDERAPSTPTLARDQALAELTRRYVKSHGPCLANDLAWWSGLSVGDAKKGLASIATELQSSIVSGKTYWFDPSQPNARRGPSLHLLPNFDEFLIAYKDHALVLDGTSARELGERDNVLGGHILIIDGQVAGGWRRTLDKDTVRVEATLLAPLTVDQEEALGLAAQRYAEYLGLSLDLRPPKRYRKASR